MSLIFLLWFFCCQTCLRSRSKVQFLWFFLFSTFWFLACFAVFYFPLLDFTVSELCLGSSFRLCRQQSRAAIGDRAERHTGLGNYCLPLWVGIYMSRNQKIGYCCRLEIFHVVQFTHWFSDSDILVLSLLLFQIYWYWVCFDFLKNLYGIWFGFQINLSSRVFPKFTFYFLVLIAVDIWANSDIFLRML